MDTPASELSRRHAFLVLNGLQGVGPVMMRALLERFGDDPIAILGASVRELLEVRGVGGKVAESLRGWRDNFPLERELKGLDDRNLRFLIQEDDDYPVALKEIHDPPVGLYCLGSPSRQPCVAMVGTPIVALNPK